MKTNNITLPHTAFYMPDSGGMIFEDCLNPEINVALSEGRHTAWKLRKGEKREEIHAKASFLGIQDLQPPGSSWLHYESDRSPARGKSALNTLPDRARLSSRTTPSLEDWQSFVSSEPKDIHERTLDFLANY